MAQTEQFIIRNRFTNAVMVTAEITCAPDASVSVKLGLAIRWAAKEKANLRDANLSGADLRYADLRYADLRYADLSDANLSGAYLSGADLRYADLRYADLRYADLSDANLSGAYLSGADLRYADLSDANLSGAYLSGADLSGADLSGADLRYADLSGADLRSFKADMWMTLAQNRHEVPALIQSLKDGKVDGSQYEGECACLVGTIANAKDVRYSRLEYNSNNPAERWFMMIRKGDKPGDDTGGGFAATKALEWAEEFQALMGEGVAA